MSVVCNLSLLLFNCCIKCSSHTWHGTATTLELIAILSVVATLGVAQRKCMGKVGMLHEWGRR